MTYKKKAIPESTRRAVALRYGCLPGQSHPVQCHWCAAPGVIEWHRLASGNPGSWVSFSLELDHVIPELHGGPSTADNIVLSCRQCNRSRGHRLTTGSRQAHDVLTEDVPETMSGKGREGNKEGKGRDSAEFQDQCSLSQGSRRVIGLGSKP